LKFPAKAMELTRILAIRHGETAWNVDTRIQGHLDIGLNAVGERQAARLGRSLAQAEAVAAIYSSDLARARQTAEAIAHARPEGALPVHTVTGLRERGFGRFEGQTFDEIQAQWPEEARRWRQREPDWVPPEGGESLLVLRERVAQTVHTLAARHLGEQIVLVAHGGVMDVLYRLATGQSLQAPRTWALPNTSVNRLLWTPQGLSLVGWADTSHLDGAERDETIT